MHQRKAAIFFLSMSSGLPFLLILSTLSIWLAEVGISKTMIGMLAWVSFPYACKFIWGALVDRKAIPILSAKLGMRRSWILLGQILVWIFLIALGSTDPARNLWATACCAFLVGCGSAIQDIAIEAYRIEILPTEKVALGASIAVLGYRFGMLIAGAGTIFLATYFDSWSVAYNVIAALMALGIITTLLCAEPEPIPLLAPSFWGAAQNLWQKFDWQIACIFILTYKIADTILNVMSMPFLVEIGFSNLQIAYVAKTFGIGAMILGGVIGGAIAHKYSLRTYLFICVLLQAISSALFVVQALVGHNVSCLFLSMGVENLACGMSQVALIAYMTHLCSQRSTALYYGLLTSFASLMRICFSTCAGWLADRFAWPEFYAIVCVSCVPSILLLFFCAKHFIQVGAQPVSTFEPNKEELVNVN